ncbi:MAG: PmoA family protein [Lewinellaceae bacterium]|nr:PmoA family protein [Lewinellaceae bacterium]
MYTHTPFLPALMLLSLSLTPVRAQQYITIQSEDLRAAGAPFFIHVETPASADKLVLENTSTGAVLALQPFQGGQMVAILESPLPAGAKHRYVLRKRKRRDPKSTLVKALVENGFVHMRVGDKEALWYALDEQHPGGGLPQHYRRSGFIHPAYSPGGAIVTDDFPAGHAHQHGIFMAWVNTLFQGRKVDFWNQHQETGTVAHWSLDTLISGPVFAEAIVHLRHIALESGPVLEERWSVRLYNSANPFIWEIDSRQLNTSADTLHILEYHYGGLGIRGSASWNPSDSLHFQGEAKMATGKGDTRQAANHTHPGWAALYGPTPKGTAGIVAMEHPANFRYPQAIRVHPTMPYFCFAPMVDGAFDLVPGIPYESRYRFITFDGPPNEESLKAYFEDFGKPMVTPYLQPSGWRR